MHIKSILASAAIALAATIGTASAAEQFSALKGVSAVVMAPQDMAEVVGGNQDGLHLRFTSGAPGPSPVVAGVPFRAPGMAGTHAQVLSVAGMPLQGNAEVGIEKHTGQGAVRPGGRGVGAPGNGGNDFPVLGPGPQSGNAFASFIINP